MELEASDKESNPATLRSRGIATMKQWCQKNGYEGVTQECLISAKNQDNSELNKMAKQHLLRGVANNGNDN